MCICVYVSIACIRAVFVENCLNLITRLFGKRVDMGHGVPSWSNIIHTDLKMRESGWCQG